MILNTKWFKYKIFFKFIKICSLPLKTQYHEHEIIIQLPKWLEIFYILYFEKIFSVNTPFTDFQPIPVLQLFDFVKFIQWIITAFAKQ